MTQADVTLEFLRARGDEGVHTFELRRHPYYIGNPSQRFAELEARGHRFRDERQKLNGDAFGKRFWLVYDAETVKEPAGAPSSHSPSATGQLFDVSAPSFDALCPIRDEAA